MNIKIIKTIYSKLNINILTYIFIAIIFVIGNFKEFLIISSLILVHEMGHLYTAKCFSWKIKEIAIYPYGGCVKFDEDINKPLKEEFFIMLNGPLIQMIFFIIICILYNNNLIIERNFELFKTYNYTLLLFNLLPIYPLDGGHLLNILLEIILPYKKGNIITIIISIIFLLITFTMYKNINFAFMTSLLAVEIFLFFRKQNILYNRLLLERYLKNIKYNKIKIIKNKKNFYKNKSHVIKINNSYITEKEFLKSRFERK